jgi:hypothetical protein
MIIDVHFVAGCITKLAVNRLSFMELHMRLSVYNVATLLTAIYFKTEWKNSIQRSLLFLHWSSLEKRRSLSRKLCTIVLFLCAEYVATFEQLGLWRKWLAALMKDKLWPIFLAQWARAVEALESGEAGSYASFGMRIRPDGDLDIHARFFRKENFYIPDCKKCNGVLKPNVIHFSNVVDRLLSVLQNHPPQ